MIRKAALLSSLICLGLVCVTADADIVVTLNASFDEAGTQPVSEGRVDPGTEVFVRILLSVTADDDPLLDIRQIQFDVTDTDTAEVKLDRAQICPAGMIAYWRLDEVSGPTYDEF